MTRRTPLRDRKGPLFDEYPGYTDGALVIDKVRYPVHAKIIREPQPDRLRYPGDICGMHVPDKISVAMLVEDHLAKTVLSRLLIEWGKPVFVECGNVTMHAHACDLTMGYSGELMIHGPVLPR